uniref:SPOC domain-containing protein n=1 Tax=Caenorhabditis japonica TaxID=281687 RepID=A0A8R1I0B9_CAEJA
MSADPDGKLKNQTETVTAETTDALRIAVTKSYPLASMLNRGEKPVGKKKSKKEEKREKRRAKELSSPSTSPKMEKKKRKVESEQIPHPFMDSDSDADLFSTSLKKKDQKKVDVDSDDDENEEKKKADKEKAIALKRARLERKEEERKEKEERKRAKEEKRRRKEHEEKILNAKEAKRRKKEAEEADVERKRKRKEAIDVDDVDQSERRYNSHSQPSSSSSANFEQFLKPRDCVGKTRKQLIAEFNCISAPFMEMKELGEFFVEREMLKEYGQTQNHLDEMHTFPEEQLLTCDSEVCPFLLTYQTPLSHLYQEARKKWTPPINESPTFAHLKNKCVNCDKLLSTVPSEMWKNYLGANSFYCSVKCIAGKVNKVMRTNPDAETVTVINALTGEKSPYGVYTRELRSFFLLAPYWMPLSTEVETRTPDTIKKKSAMLKDSEKDKRKMGALSKPIPKKNPETIDSVRQANRTHLESAMNNRIEKMHWRQFDRRNVKELAEQIEEKLFERCDRNISHPRYRVWKQQFIHNFEADSAREFVIAVLSKRLTVEKLVAMDANSLRNPASWKMKPTGGAIQSKRKSIAARNPLDAIIGDDTRDTTAEHMSHSFSKTCRVCQSKQLDEARAKLKKQEEQQEIDRRKLQTMELENMRKIEHAERYERERELKKIRAEQASRDAHHRQRKSQEERDDDDYVGGGIDSPIYDFEGPSHDDSSIKTPTRKEPSRREKRSERQESDDWKFSTRFVFGETTFSSAATPIFAQTTDNRPLFRLMERELADRKFLLHTPRRIQDFLLDSNRAMNENESCNFAVLKLSPNSSSDTFKKVLEFILQEDFVYQLNYPVGEEIISVFLFPHRSSEILHGRLKRRL